MKSISLIDFFDVERGTRLKQSDRIPGEIPLVTAGYVNDGIAGYIKSNQKIFNNAVTIDMFGNVFWRPYSFSCDDNIIVLTSNNLTSETAYYFLLMIKKTCVGFNYSHQYRMKDLKKHIINVPYTSANSLDLALIHKMSDHLKRLIQSRDNLNSSLKEECIILDKRFEFYRNKLLSFVNKDFTKQSLEECIISLRTGLNPRQNFKLNVEGAVYPYITGKDIFNNKINVTDKTDKITKEAVDLINKRAKLEDNILLFASTGTGTVGRMAIIEKYDGLWNLSETMYCIKTKTNILPSFLMHYLYSKNARDQFDTKISKGSVPHLKVSDLLKVQIPVVSLEVQNKYVKYLNSYSSKNLLLISKIKEEIGLIDKKIDFYVRDVLLLR